MSMALFQMNSKFMFRKGHGGVQGTLGVIFAQDERRDSGEPGYNFEACKGDAHRESHLGSVNRGLNRPRTFKSINRQASDDFYSWQNPSGVRYCEAAVEVFAVGHEEQSSPTNSHRWIYRCFSQKFTTQSPWLQRAAS